MEIFHTLMHTFGLCPEQLFPLFILMEGVREQFYALRLIAYLLANEVNLVLGIPISFPK